MADAEELPREPRFRFDDEDVETILSEWRQVGRQCLREVEQFTRERPAESLAVAFLAGVVLGTFLGRR